MARSLTAISKFPKDLEEAIIRDTNHWLNIAGVSKELTDQALECKNAKCRCKVRMKENEGLKT